MQIAEADQPSPQRQSAPRPLPAALTVESFYGANRASATMLPLSQLVSGASSTRQMGNAPMLPIKWKLPPAISRKRRWGAPAHKRITDNGGIGAPGQLSKPWKLHDPLVEGLGGSQGKLVSRPLLCIPCQPSGMPMATLQVLSASVLAKGLSLTVAYRLLDTAQVGQLAAYLCSYVLCRSCRPGSMLVVHQGKACGLLEPPNSPALLHNSAASSWLFATASCLSCVL